MRFTARVSQPQLSCSGFSLSSKLQTISISANCNRTKPSPASKIEGFVTLMLAFTASYGGKENQKFKDDQANDVRFYVG
ncbi:hypothetical protein ACOSQ2_022110 [Xanthoceras sorbifolium]